MSLTRFQKAIKIATAAGLTRLGSGRHRVTFALNDAWVLKLPRNARGEEANRSEMEQVWNLQDPQHPFLAWCMIEEWQGVTVCLMERVERIEVDFHEILRPEHPFHWVRAVDEDPEGFQVGYTREGQLVAYDYSYE